MSTNRPSIVLMADGAIGLKMAELLAARNENVLALVVEPPEQNRWGRAICATLHLPSNRVFLPKALKTSSFLEQLQQLQPDLILSITWSHILPAAVIETAQQAALNIHNGLLPYNRGWHSNVWAIREGTPSGVTIHHLDPGIDTGDTAFQLSVETLPTDTGASLYQRLQVAMWELLESSWPRIVAGDIPRVPQDNSIATHHFRKELTVDDEIDLDKSYRAGDLINLIRGRSFAPHPGAYFHQGGKKVYIRLNLELAAQDEAVAENKKVIRRAS